MLKPELLVPAGNLEKLKYACHFGADAVYLGLPVFSLRSNKKAFNWETLVQGIEYAHERNVKVYVTINIFARNHELDKLPKFLTKLRPLKPDGIILADPGVMEIVKEYLPETEIHLSTQSSVLNWGTSKFWAKQGVKRIILAREVNLREIAEIRDEVPGLEIETFVHGALCMAYSGRCLISSYVNNRDANHGDCTNSCRWNYSLVEEKRPGEYFPVEEDQHGTYFFNSKDLCLVSYLPDLIQSGVCSFKVEGRTKSLYYLSIVTRAYRKAIDSYMEDPKNFDPIPFLKEIMTTSNRMFTSAFIDNDKSDPEMQEYERGYPVQHYNFVGQVQLYDSETKQVIFHGKNKIEIGDEIEFVTKDKIITKIVERITTIKDKEVEKVNPNETYKIDLDEPVDSYTMIRRKNVDIDDQVFNDLVHDQYISIGQKKVANI